MSFWFTPANPIGLHSLRFFAGLVFLTWLLTLAGRQTAFFGLNGWFDVQAFEEAARLPGGAPVPFGWSILYLCGNDPTNLLTMYWGSVGVLLLFTLGIGTRITSILTWIIVVSFVSVNPVVSFGGDFLLSILAFYLMLGYLLYRQWTGGLSLVERLLGPRETIVFHSWFFRNQQTDQDTSEAYSYAVNFALRLLQVHFAIVVFTTALHKLQMADWWAGVALWYPLHPPFDTTFESVRTKAWVGRVYLCVLSFIQYSFLAWQFGFPLMAWRQGWRWVLVGGGFVGLLGSVFVFGLPVFGPVFLLGCFSYLTASEWQQFWQRLSQPQHLFSWLASRVWRHPQETAKAAG
ncbi:MAG: hypothetical protein ACFCD0_05730 [Gemmataceae bacterium]